MRNRRMRWMTIPVMAIVTFALAGCTTEQLQGWMPATPGLTNHVDRIMGLWVTSWIVLLGVGLITWGLMIWCAIVYRRRRGQTGLPVQLRYNMPIEIFFTVVPVIFILGFFAFTARDQAAIEAPHADGADYTITVFGKRWSWDFVYHLGDPESDNPSDHVFLQTDQTQNLPNSGEIDPASIPTLYLPANSRIEIILESRDVAHSFWIVEFLYKKDMLPGVTNHMYFETGDPAGPLMGKCAELCGEYHSMMLFNVEIIPVAEYEAYLDSLAAQGNVGNPNHDFSPDSALEASDLEEATP